MKTILKCFLSNGSIEVAKSDTKNAELRTPNAGNRSKREEKVRNEWSGQNEAFLPVGEPFRKIR